MLGSSAKVLFILKRREDYNQENHYSPGLITGLYNSASFLVDMLNDNLIESKLVVVTDNNDIDREVTQYKPTHVIIEALWVVPEKFEILQKLHPTAKWIIRLHSELPFISGEGMAMNWLGEYSNHHNVIIACNSPKMMHEIKKFITRKCTRQAANKVILLPNYYPQNYKPAKSINKSSGYIDIGCFGAIRPMKNHLIQAFSAMSFAESIGKTLRFHINSNRIEMQGEPVYNNLNAMFIHNTNASLVDHGWIGDRDKFLELCESMDIGMQCSFSETFNIVGADFISQGVPFVSSQEIPWSSKAFSAHPTDSEDILFNLQLAYTWPKINVWHNRAGLNKYTNQSRSTWLKYFK